MATVNIYDGLLSSGLRPHPDDVSDWLEQLWASGSKAWNLDDTVDGRADTKPPSQVPAANPGDLSVSWPNLMYALLIGNTMVYEIFAQVLKEYFTGEKLGVPTPDAANWLRLTETLFYRHPPANSILSVVSEIRPDQRAVWDNACMRMYGMCPNHRGTGNQAQGQAHTDATNRNFVAYLEEFLREVWIGIANSTNTSGAKPTDDAKIAYKVHQLYESMLQRRRGWNLYREEFSAVAVMAWFEYALASNTEIVKSLRAEAGSPSARLANIARRTGTRIPRMTDEYFQMAVPLSNTLHLIESGRFNNIASAQLFYSAGPIRQDLMTIIDKWSCLTGHDLKSTRVQLSRV